jgi:hypothetical protein
MALIAAFALVGNGNTVRCTFSTRYRVPAAHSVRFSVSLDLRKEIILYCYLTLRGLTIFRPRPRYISDDTRLTANVRDLLLFISSGIVAIIFV